MKYCIILQKICTKDIFRFVLNHPIYLVCVLRVLLNTKIISMKFLEMIRGTKTVHDDNYSRNYNQIMPDSMQFIMRLVL
jgi:hypothetical protein